MKTPEEIKTKIEELRASEADLEKNIQEESAKPLKTPAIAATIYFYNSQKKLINAKIEAHNWVLDIVSE